MIDRDLVIRKLLLVQRDLDLVEPLARKPLSEYLANPTDELAAERLLERCIGRLIDVNFHLITESGHPPPSDYFDSFLEIGALGIVDRQFARRVAACAGLRNRIAHEYDEIDPERVHAALTTALGDLPEWMRAIQEFVERGGPA